MATYRIPFTVEGAVEVEAESYEDAADIVNGNIIVDLAFDIPAGVLVEGEWYGEPERV